MLSRLGVISRMDLSTLQYFTFALKSKANRRMASFICFFSNIRKFGRSLFQFSKFSKSHLRIFQLYYCSIANQYLDACDFLGKARITVYKLSLVYQATRNFPKKYKHLNIVLRTFQSRIRNWKRAFRKFGKLEERSSKFLEI